MAEKVNGYVACYLCKKKKAMVNKMYSNMLGLIDNSDKRVYTCKDCGHKFIYPYFDDDTLSQIYANAYFTGNYDELSLNLLKEPEVSHEQTQRLQELKISKFNNTLDLISRYTENQKSIFDIGAATGEFLYLASKRGLLVDGLEPSEYAARIAKEKYGFTFHNCKLEDFRANHQYDIITMNHVFEHFVDPHIVLKVIYNLVSKGGIVYLEIPFQFNFPQVMKYILLHKKDNFNIYSIHHPNFYSPKTLIKLFNMNGFDNLYISLFNKDVYKQGNFITKMKGYAWQIMACFDHGSYIEAVFQKN